MPALATKLAGYAGVRLAVTYFVRPHFEAPLTKGIALRAGSVGFLGSPTSVHLVPGATIPNGCVLSTTVANKAGHPPTTAFLRHTCPTVFGFNVRGARRVLQLSVLGTLPLLASWP